jgi:glycosyltransferase involved in cell wall biosynthesis
MREKGFFDTIDGVLLANEQLRADGSPLRLYLTLAGSFHCETERAEFQRRMEQSDTREAVRWLGFVSGEQKLKCLTHADLLCFPTYYSAETRPLTLIESMACGLPLVTARWRSVPDMLPRGYSAIVAPKSPGEIARALRGLLTENPCRALREHYLRHFTLEKHLEDMAAAIRRVEE